MQKTISTLDFFDTELKGTIFMTRLTKYEKETIILTNEEDNFWNVFTYNKGLQRRFISFAEQYPENCRFKSQNNEGGMTFEIKDDGVGIVADKQKTTEIFYQQNVKDSLKHSGMGMYISRLYCEKHGGRLLIENEKQSGAVITAVFCRIA